MEILNVWYMLRTVHAIILGTCTLPCLMWLFEKHCSKFLYEIFHVVLSVAVYWTKHLTKKSGSTPFCSRKFHDKTELQLPQYCTKHYTVKILFFTGARKHFQESDIER